MNFLRSKIAAYKGSSQQEQKQKSSESSLYSKQTRNKVFESIKQWDKQRAQTLGKHIKVVEEILRNIEVRVRNSQQYLLSIEGILKARLRELQAYKANSLNNSTFVLMSKHEPGYKQSYELLKQLVIFEAQKDDKLTRKYNKIREIYKEFADWKSRDSQKEIALAGQSPSTMKDKQAENKSQYQQGQENGQLDESSVVMLKSNVRYLIDFELPQIIEESARLCEQINKAFHREGSSSTDVYILVTKFLHVTKRQVQKHRQIGRQLLAMNKDFIQREKKRSVKIKNTLSEWVKQDQNANPILIKQLEKEGNENLIQDYYNLEDLLENDQLLVKNTTIDSYLLNVSIGPFQRAEELVLFRADAFYNKKIETEVIITVDRFCHLRKPNHLDPDFSFVLNKEIHFHQVEEFVFKVQKLQKKFLKAAEKEFEFCLEFNVQDDIERLIEVLEDIQWVNLRCI